MKQFEIPDSYRSNLISYIKELRKVKDKLKKDWSPTIVHFKDFEVVFPRHFGFCFGVENAIEIAYKAIAENKGKQLYLLSQMIHNPTVNQDLEAKGLRFIQNTKGEQLIPWEEISKEAVVVVPAFGVSLENKTILEKIGVNLKQYNTTCPFVERVWNKSKQIGQKGYTVVVHGKQEHEETKATFSRACKTAPSIIIRDIEEAEYLAQFIGNKTSEKEFKNRLEGLISEGFDATKDLVKIGVVNQTTMLASETEEISRIIKQAIETKSKENSANFDFADTRDTLCYATNDNQSAALSLAGYSSDLAVVVGGENSSNTSHLVELLQKNTKTVFIQGSESITDEGVFISYNLKNQKTEEVKDEGLSYDHKTHPQRIQCTASCNRQEPPNQHCGY